VPGWPGVPAGSVASCRTGKLVTKEATPRSVPYDRATPPPSLPPGSPLPARSTDAVVPHVCSRQWRGCSCWRSGWLNRPWVRVSSPAPTHHPL
jgi:hypothetical protein